MNWEVRIDILPGVEELASGTLQYATGSSARSSAMAWSGGMGGERLRREGICPCFQQIHFVV